MQIIGVLGTYLQDSLVGEIDEAGAFSVLADEVSDSSNNDYPSFQGFSTKKEMSEMNSLGSTSVNMASLVRL